MKLDLGCGPNKAQGFVGVDVRAQEGVDVVTDLSERWPFEDNSVEHVRACHVFEHLPDTLHTMDELYRVLKPGARAEIDVPSTNGMGAFQDPTHKSFWNVNTFIYFDREQGLGALYGCNKWNVLHCTELNQFQIAWWGPVVKAVIEKPAEEGEGNDGLQES
jgi:ubiquinone/menaquinone biosynthesis C-methylase UbiE